MSRNIRGRIRMLFAVPSAAVLVLGATQALASPAPSARLPDCDQFCWDNALFCEANPTASLCRYCGC
jgi:hypothetical protein